MRRLLPSPWWGPTLMIALWTSSLPAGRAAEQLPQVDAVLHRFVEHAKTDHGGQTPVYYVCTKQTVTEDYGPNGAVTDRKVKIGEAQSGGSGRANANKWTSQNGFNLDEELLSRYAFTIEDKENLNGRPAYVLSFVPRTPPAPIHHLQDHFLNRVIGTLWIDTQDYELVKARISLGRPVSFGILGGVDALTFSFERGRSDEGNWLTRWTETFVKARKFMRPIETHKRVDWSDFRKVRANG